MPWPLIEDAQPALALGRKALLVRVPAPARFAAHKLIVVRIFDSPRPGST